MEENRLGHHEHSLHWRMLGMKRLWKRVQTWGRRGDIWIFSRRMSIEAQLVSKMWIQLFLKTSSHCLGSVYWELWRETEGKSCAGEIVKKLMQNTRSCESEVFRGKSQAFQCLSHGFHISKTLAFIAPSWKKKNSLGNRF